MDSGSGGGGGSSGTDGGKDGGRDAGIDAGYDAGPPPPIACVEAEAAMLNGVVQTWPGTKETNGGTAVLGAQGQGSLQMDFELFKTTNLTAWVRVRALTHANNALTVTLDEDLDAGVDPDAGLNAATVWDVPVSPVLRWQRVDLRGDGGTFWRAEQKEWPGSVGAGMHHVLVTGREPGVELDALCLYPKGAVPDERLPELPDRVVTDILTGAAGDGVSDDTTVLRTAFMALKVGDVLMIPAGRYRFTAPLVVGANNVALVGAEDGGTVLFADLPANTTSAALTIAGATETSAAPLIEDAPALSHEVAVALGSTVQAGDAVLVSSDDWGPTAPNGAGLFFRMRANTAHVVNARNEPSRRVLVLDRPLLGPFLVTHKAKVERFSPLRDFVMRRVSIDGPARANLVDGGPGNPDIDLVLASRCDRCFFADLSLSHFRVSGLDTFKSLDTQIIRVHASNASATGPDGRGHGVTVNRAQGTVVRDSRFDGVLRQGVALTGGARETFVVRNVFDRRTAQAAEKLASVGLHGEDSYANLVEGNLVQEGDPGIAVGGGGTAHGNDGPFNVIRNNDLRDVTDGVAVFKSTYETVVEGNTIARPTGAGVRLEGFSNGAYVWTNAISAWATAGVSTKDVAGTDVRGNTFSPGPSTVSVRIADGGGYTVRDNALGDGGTVEHPDAGDVGGNR